ncbi:hypothetical protein Mapa_009685 [Marchantia paleacea]|nr:hypothetical protein Mapa_009685 [Marchantia paleacea]
MHHRERSQQCHYNLIRPDPIRSQRNTSQQKRHGRPRVIFSSMTQPIPIFDFFHSSNSVLHSAVLALQIHRCDSARPVLLAFTESNYCLGRCTVKCAHARERAIHCVHLSVASPLSNNGAGVLP